MYGEKNSILQVKPIEQVNISLVIDIYIKSNQREGENNEVAISSNSWSREIQAARIEKITRAGKVSIALIIIY